MHFIVFAFIFCGLITNAMELEPKKHELFVSFKAFEESIKDFESYPELHDEVNLLYPITSKEELEAKEEARAKGIDLERYEEVLKLHCKKHKPIISKDDFIGIIDDATQVAIDKFSTAPWADNAPITKEFFNNKLIPTDRLLHDKDQERYGYYIPFTQAFTVKPEQTVVAVGDLHGGIISLKEMVKKYLKHEDGSSFKLKDNVIFVSCGDDVDRGIYGVEVLTLLALLYKHNPDQVKLVRGNHEDLSLNKASGGFCPEVQAKYGYPDRKINEDKDAIEILNKISRFYDSMPVAVFAGYKAWLGKTVWKGFVHGGLEYGEVNMPSIFDAAAKNGIACKHVGEVIDAKEHKIIVRRGRNYPKLPKEIRNQIEGLAAQVKINIKTINDLKEEKRGIIEGLKKDKPDKEYSEYENDPRVVALTDKIRDLSKKNDQLSKISGPLSYNLNDFRPDFPTKGTRVLPDGKDANEGLSEGDLRVDYQWGMINEGNENDHCHLQVKQGMSFEFDHVYVKAMLGLYGNRYHKVTEIIRGHQHTSHPREYHQYPLMEKILKNLGMYTLWNIFTTMGPTADSMYGAPDETATKIDPVTKTEVAIKKYPGTPFFTAVELHQKAGWFAPYVIKKAHTINILPQKYIDKHNTIMKENAERFPEKHVTKSSWGAWFSRLKFW